jgi:hypothetical protein
MALDGAGLGAVAAGSVFVYAGIKGISVPAALTSIVRGESPATLPATAAITGTVPDAGTAGTPNLLNVPGTNKGPPPPPGNTGAASATAAANQATARLLAAPYGWSAGQQWASLVSLWNQESGWNNQAQNPTTACGIAQFLDTTWGPYGPKTSDPVLQITYGLRYIKDRYGSPAAAWAHEVANNWY